MMFWIYIGCVFWSGFLLGCWWTTRVHERRERGNVATIKLWFALTAEQRRRVMSNTGPASCTCDSAPAADYYDVLCPVHGAWRKDDN